MPPRLDISAFLPRRPPTPQDSTEKLNPPSSLPPTIPHNPPPSRLSSEYELTTLNILKAYTEHRTISISSTISALADPTGNAYTLGKPQNQLALYTLVLEYSRTLPWNFSSQVRLVDIFEGLKERPGPSAPIAEKALLSRGCRKPSWTTLEGFGTCAREEWKDAPDGHNPNVDFEVGRREWMNVAAFVASLTARGGLIL